MITKEIWSEVAILRSRQKKTFTSKFSIVKRYWLLRSNYRTQNQPASVMVCIWATFRLQVVVSTRFHSHNRFLSVETLAAAVGHPTVPPSTDWPKIESNLAHLCPTKCPGSTMDTSHTPTCLASHKLLLNIMLEHMEWQKEMWRYALLCNFTKIYAHLRNATYSFLDLILHISVQPPYSILQIQIPAFYPYILK